MLKSSPACTDFCEYDQTIDSWIKKVDFGGLTRSGAAGFSIGSKGYIGTGLLLNAKNNRITATTLYKDFWEYGADNCATPPIITSYYYFSKCKFYATNSNR
jgi:hypothetical protein